MNRYDRRRAALAAACALCLVIAGIVIAGCGSGSRAVKLASTNAITVNTRTGTAEGVALTGTSTDSSGTATGTSTTFTSQSSTDTTTTGSTTDTTGTSTIADAQGIGVTSGGINNLTRPFASDSPWNTTVANAPIASNSHALIDAANERFGVTGGSTSETVTTGLIGGATAVGTGSGAVQTAHRNLHTTVFINTTIWTDPIVLSNGGNQVSVVCRQINLPPPKNDCGDGWDVKSLSLPVTGFPKPPYDGWLTVIDQNTGFAYDLWRARLNGNVMTYQFMRRWDLGGPGFLAPSNVSARGSGLPLFAGEILPHDIESGHIDHALAMSVPGPASRFYVQPASSTDGNGAFDSLPEGARIRLKSSFNIGFLLHHPCTKLRKTECLPGGVSVPSARAILVCLRQYGAIIVDRGAIPTLYAVPNFDWSAPLRNKRGQLLSFNGTSVLPPAYQNAKRYGTPLLSGAAVGSLDLSDFNVVALPTIHEFPPVAGQSVAGGVNGVVPQPTDGGTTGTKTLSTTGSGSGAGTAGVGSAEP